MPSSPEITAAAKVIAKDHYSEWVQAHSLYLEEWHTPMIWNPPAEPTARTVAEMALKAAEAAREKSARFAAVGQIQLPGGALKHVVVAPFSTELQARRAGEGLQHDPVTKTGNGRFMVIPIAGNPREAWDMIRPEEKDPKAWISESIHLQRLGIVGPINTSGIYKDSYFEGRDKW